MKYVYDNRKHCTHRVQRLRQLLHLTKPNNKKTNQQNELPEKISDARYLQLFVFEVERAWAYAMDLNQELSADTRKRHHTRKKLKRATQHAEALYQLCEQQDVEDRSKLEVKVNENKKISAIYIRKGQISILLY